MKKIYPLIVTCLTLVMILSLNGCGRESATEDQVEAQVNPVYEMNPPVAREVSIQTLKESKDGNLLLMADLGKQIKGRFHAIQLSTGKVVLRDDGKGGDQTADDGKFSVVLKEDIASLNSKLEELQRRNKERARTAPFDFVARHKVKLDVTKAKATPFDFASFQAGKPATLPDAACFIDLNVSTEHSLLVTEVKTVEDMTRISHPCNCTGTANGAWTFQRLMTDMANTPVTNVTPEDFVKDWLNTWLDLAVVNGEEVQPRRQRMFDNVIKPWVIASGSLASQFNDTNWRSRPLNLARAPFKLIAIVNRLDLHGNVGYGVSNAGEGRFVFEVLNQNCIPLDGQFTVIFEYGIPITDCRALQAYARKWYDLKDIPQGLGSPEYNSALQEITDVFASANASPTKPNGSAINQIRTNERAIGAPWELREFNVDKNTHKLFLTTVKQEPAEKYNESAPVHTVTDVAKLVNWINSNSSDILQNKHTVPLTIPDDGAQVDFLGGKAHSEPGLWTGTGIIDPEVRHHFSFNTCSGCHQQETGTPFVHLSTVQFTQESTASGFLRGIVLPDPVSGASHSFGDLEERRRKLADLLCATCTGDLFELVNALTFVPNKMVH